MYIASQNLQRSQAKRYKYLQQHQVIEKYSPLSKIAKLVFDQIVKFSCLFPGNVFVSQQKIADEINGILKKENPERKLVDRTYVNKCCKYLESIGLIESYKRYNDTNEYFLLFDIYDNTVTKYLTVLFPILKWFYYKLKDAVNLFSQKSSHHISNNIFKTSTVLYCTNNKGIDKSVQDRTGQAVDLKKGNKYNLDQTKSCEWFTAQIITQNRRDNVMNIPDYILNIKSLVLTEAGQIKLTLYYKEAIEFADSEMIKIIQSGRSVSGNLFDNFAALAYKFALKNNRIPSKSDFAEMFNHTLPDAGFSKDSKMFEGINPELIKSAKEEVVSHNFKKEENKQNFNIHPRLKFLYKSNNNNSARERYLKICFSQFQNWKVYAEMPHHEDTHKRDADFICMNSKARDWMLFRYSKRLQEIIVEYPCLNKVDFGQPTKSFYERNGYEEAQKINDLYKSGKLNALVESFGSQEKLKQKVEESIEKWMLYARTGKFYENISDTWSEDVNEDW